MQIARWGNSLAIRLPARLVEEMGLKEGDQIELVAGQGSLHAFRVRAKSAEWDQFFAECDARPAVPADYRFDRDEANAR
ncbi:AbrB/MazE/SpoVT family DNA-binding domain-containing protein [Geminicoccus flavidas]|uniref:AbrB/MazE/SpoVT family DNA-binding domain-containing protein n=1 Tax=Geminicoccus flavidas TaxID=2506407 RepID=UPI00135943BC|nr:AbrB/MazE/SpoVT family DNA-binding domain-containing protein [Geminicoccus flavidas]